MRKSLLASTILATIGMPALVMPALAQTTLPGSNAGASCSATVSGTATPGVTVSAALPASLIPPGYLSTSGSQIVDAAGDPVRIASVGWFTGYDSPDAQLQQILLAGFNTVRLPYYNATLQSDLANIDAVVSAASQYGVRVIIDHHADETPSASNNYLPQQPNGLPIDSGPGTDGTDGAGDTGIVTLSKFIADWVTIAQRYAGNSTVIGFDLDNEPLHYAGMSTWGDGSPTDLRAMYIQAGNAIQAVDPGALIIAEGPQNYQMNFAGTAPAPYGDLSLAASQPVTLNNPNMVVYSVHDYPATIGGFSPDSGPQAVANMNADFGYLVTQNIAPVWIGEMGGSLDGTSESAGTGLADEQAWAATLVSYLNGQAPGGPAFTGQQQAMPSSWWAWGNLAGEEPDGTLTGGGSLNQPQWNVYSPLQQTPLPCSMAEAVPAGLVPNATQEAQALAQAQQAVAATATAPADPVNPVASTAIQPATGPDALTAASTPQAPVPQSALLPPVDPATAAAQPTEASAAEAMQPMPGNAMVAATSQPDAALPASALAEADPAVQTEPMRVKALIQQAVQAAVRAQAAVFKRRAEASAAEAQPAMPSDAMAAAPPQPAPALPGSALAEADPAVQAELARVQALVQSAAQAAVRTAAQAQAAIAEAVAALDVTTAAPPP